MAFVSYDTLLGTVDLSNVDTAGPGPLNLTAGTGSGRLSFYSEEIRGCDPVLGAGTFVFAKSSGSITAGNWVQLSFALDSSSNVTVSAAAWAGTANTAEPLAVALNTTTNGQFSWFQIQGAAVATTNGTVASGDKVYWQASATSSSSAVAGKQVIGAKAVSANAATIGSGSSQRVLSASQSVIYLNRPNSQSAIT